MAAHPHLFECHIRTELCPFATVGLSVNEPQLRSVGMYEYTYSSEHSKQPTAVRMWTYRLELQQICAYLCFGCAVRVKYVRVST